MFTLIHTPHTWTNVHLTDAHSSGRTKVHLTERTTEYL